MIKDSSRAGEVSFPAVQSATPGGDLYQAGNLSLGVPVRVFPGRFNQGGKICPACGRGTSVD